MRWIVSDQQGIEQALNYFQRALDLDPQFANAAVGIGFAYTLLGEDYYMPAPEAFETGAALRTAST